MNTLFLIFVSGFSIGLLGSFHCVGMCGPLALALPINNFTSFKKALAIIFYNSGKAFSYAAMGFAFGIIGQSFSVFKLQQYLSIAAGIFILLVLALAQFSKYQSPLLDKYSSLIKAKLSSLLKSEKKIISYLSIGIVNGFLPCGLVYIGLAAAVATGSIAKSGLLMLAFGLGTMPLMALTMVLGKYISLQFRRSLNKLTPYIIVSVACLLILRGMNLGIPYVSPTHDAQHKSCCQEE